MQLLSNCCHTGVQSVRACMQSCFSQLFQLCERQWTAAHQIPLSMRFSRQEYWSWLPSPPPGDLPDPGITLPWAPHRLSQSWRGSSGGVQATVSDLLMEIGRAHV